MFDPWSPGADRHVTDGLVEHGESAGRTPLRDLQSHRQALVPGLQAALDPVRWLR